QRAIMEQIIARKTREFDPSQFHDHYQTAVRELIDEKLQGKLPAKAPERKPAQVINLMEALKRSLAEEEGAAGKAPARRGATGSRSRAAVEPEEVAEAPA